MPRRSETQPKYITTEDNVKRAKWKVIPWMLQSLYDDGLDFWFCICPTGWGENYGSATTGE